tara:strand:+ start:960 stop:1127 length:168 start_codon:yes stop_codon:yes gene_type:complete
MNKTESQALVSVLDYMWNNEERHYLESDKPNNHIFEKLQILDKYLTKKGLNIIQK